MKRSLTQLVSLTTVLFTGALVLAVLDGCSSSQTTSGTQEAAQAIPPPPPPPEPPPDNLVIEADPEVPKI